MRADQGQTNDLIERYLNLTKYVLPDAAPQRDWPVRNDHCFQRIVLDAVSSGVWYDHIARPAYKHLSVDQAAQAVQLCEEILSGEADLWDLNNRSLNWRGKAPRRRPA